MTRKIQKITLLLALPLLLIAGPGQASASAETSPRVIDGTPTANKQWPFLVGLAIRRDNRGKPIASGYWGQFCGGVLLTRRWVLTADHCVTDMDDRNLDVLVGRTNLARANQGERIPALVSVLNNRVHIPLLSANDYALIRLSRPARKGKPLGLRRLGKVISGAQARVAGWGLDRLDIPTSLQEGSVPVWQDDACRAAYYDRVIGPQVHTPSMFCAGYLEGGQDSCQGDSGGPLMQNRKLVGLVSWGIGCGEAGYPGVYTRVSGARKWINRWVRNTMGVNWKREQRLINPPKRSIRERPGWKAPLIVEWSLAYTGPGVGCDSDYCDIWDSVYVGISSNYKITEPRLSSTYKLCPEIGPPPSPERCFESETVLSENIGNVQIGYGGRSANWGGNILDTECASLHLSAITGGQRRGRTLSACNPYGVFRTTRPVLGPDGRVRQEITIREFG